jgi:hypothetical protein
MDKTLKQIRFFLFNYSGEDKYILKRCNTVIQKRFALIGSFVLLIFVGCFFSATLFSYSLFQGAKWTSIPIGLFWGAMVVNIYLLLLHTISPAIIPLASKVKRKKKNIGIERETKLHFLNLSMLLRVGFMMLLAVIIAQPLNYSLLSFTVNTHLEKHNIKERVTLYSLTNKHLIQSELNSQKEFNSKINKALYGNDAQKVKIYLANIDIKINGDKTFIDLVTKKINQLNKIEGHLFLNSKENQQKTKLINQIDRLLTDQIISDNILVSTLNSSSISGKLKTDFDNYKMELLKLTNEKIDNYNKLNDLLNKSNFYIKTIQLLLVENPLSWIITGIICLLFLLPIFFKYKVRDISANLFLYEQGKNKELTRLRKELINTTDYNWLEHKIKSIKTKDIVATDYYFQRMLIEHKIILEEYDETKKEFSKLLTENIKSFNQNCLNKLLPIVEKLKKINSNKYQEYKEKIFEEYKNEVIVKYEYWLDCPFRTEKIKATPIFENHNSFLDFFYNTSNNEEDKKQSE